MIGKKTRLKVLFGVVFLVAALAATAGVARADFPYGHGTPTVACVNYFNGSAYPYASQVEVNTPTMSYYYDNPLSGGSGIAKTWQPFLFYLTTSGWQRATSVDAPQLRPNGYGPYVFSVAPGYTYRVAILYRWFTIDGVHSEYTWAGTHTQYGEGILNGVFQMWQGTSGASCYVNKS